MRFNAIKENLKGSFLDIGPDNVCFLFVLFVGYDVKKNRQQKQK